MAVKKRSTHHTGSRAAIPVQENRYLRYEWLDFLRGIALSLMIVFHFVYDLGYFELIDINTNKDIFWWTFRRVIVFLFVFISGISFGITASRGINWSHYRTRVLQVATGAIAVSIATYVADPSKYVYMGILHFFAISSVLVILFKNFGRWNFLIGLIIIAIATITPKPKFGSDSWCFTSLESSCRYTADWAPLFPWFGVLLLGLSFTPYAQNLLGSLRSKYTPQDIKLSWVSLMGQHSLVVYLVHQPILLALFYLYTSIASTA